ncbi:hypothetical protein GA0111570_11425 [Raineyella antarctica]|uniref:Uncharacterized protein n=1 Tax=Raineyella antarctica TaxID=1577474 RepID=A0A1G6I4L7_9ACTN|nr:hypothetical protein [Raineyella antarctica]SDC01370.1 hypothetical protein GA0111570_11425 [Raineyella antarctica]
MPIVLGLAAGVTAIYTPLFGGIENILAILWLVPLLASPLAILGAALLLRAVRADRRPRSNVITAATVALLGLALTVALFVRTGTVTDLQALAGLPTHPPDLAGTQLLAFELVAGTLALMYDIGVWALVGLGARHLHGEPDETR